MLKLILGRASSGKSTHVRSIIKKCVADKKKITLIVPEQFSFESEKSIIEMLGAKKAAEVNIFSFTSLSKHIIDEYNPTAKPFVSQAVKEVIMSLTLEALTEQLCVFSKCAKNKNTVSDILKLTDEMIGCDMTPESILEAAQKSGNSILIKKAEELGLISSLYSSILTSRFTDDRYIINAAAQIISENKLFLGTTVVFDEFTGFTPQENLILAEILKQAEDVFVTQCADSIADYSHGTGAFSFATENIGKLISLANKTGVKVAEPVIFKNDGRYNSPELSFLEKGIYEPNPEIYEFDAPDVTIAAAKNIYEECDFAAMTAKRLVRTQGLRYRDIVIVSRGNAYAKQLTHSLKKFGIPVFEDNRRKLDTQIIAVFILTALSVVADGFSTELILRYIKTYLAGIGSDDISLLENYTLMWDIDYGEWLNDWKGNPKGMGTQLDENAEKELQHINKLRLDIIKPLLKLKKEMADGTATECTSAVYNFLINVKADEHLLDFALKLNNENAFECERSWDEMMNILSLFSETLGERSITPSRYLELLRIMISSSDLGELPTGLDEITVGDADRIRVANKKVLFIVGANDGVFPSTGTSSFVLTDNERKLLKIQQVELGTAGTDAVRKERLRVYTTMSIPSDRLFITYSLGTIKGESSSPSEIVAMTQAILPKCKKIDIASLPAIETVESAASAFESAAENFRNDSVYAASVKKYIKDTKLYKDKFLAVERAARKKKAEFDNPENAKALFGEKMYITPSRVEDYYKCPFKYFCEYGIKARTAEKAKFDSRQTGLMVHFILEKLFAAYGSGGLVKMTQNERKTAVFEQAELYISTYIGKTETLNSRVIFALHRCRDTVCDILERLVDEFSNGEFETQDVELKIGTDGVVAPYSINLPDGGNIMLMGVVDRIDTMVSKESGKTYLRVIDYKSGGKDFTLTDIMSGLNIQMLVYLICLFENGKERYGDFIPAGILYVPAKNGKNELGRNATQAEIDASRAKQGVMKGIVLCEPEVIKGMDADADGKIIEAKINAKGEIKGKVFTRAQFELLHKKVDKIITEMALSLQNGKIQAVPVLDGHYKNTCNYCDYKTVCSREENDEWNMVFKGDIWEALEEEINNGSKTVDT